MSRWQTELRAAARGIPQAELQVACAIDGRGVVVQPALIGEAGAHGLREPRFPLNDAVLSQDLAGRVCQAKAQG